MMCFFLERIKYRVFFLSKNKHRNRGKIPKIAQLIA